MLKPFTGNKMKYLAVAAFFAAIGMVALPWLVLSQISSPGTGPNGETLAVCGMPILGAFFAAPIGAFGGGLLGLLTACFIPNAD
jgi:hypothetical protein